MGDSVVNDALVLCIEGEPESQRALREGLDAMGHRAVLAATLAEARAALVGERVHLILIASRVEDGQATEFLGSLQSEGATIPTIVTLPHREMGDGAAFVARGAVAYLTKPLRAEALRIAVEGALEVARLRHAEQTYREELCALRGSRAIVGTSSPLRRALDLARMVAPTRATVLIEGESGTGKELVARAVHEWSSRADHPMVAVNCAALPDGLVESTFFGHERGAFTGALDRAAGAFERAHRGTLLLDEVSEMRLDPQAKLLRVIQEQEFERVGGQGSVRVDVRLVATTNLDLRQAVEDGRFRRDLFFRLKVVSIALPPLRDRREDIPMLAYHFVRRFAAEAGREAPEIPRDVMRRLSAHPWPGNIRELSNVLERAVVISAGNRLDTEALEFTEVGPADQDRRGGAGPAAEAPAAVLVAHPDSFDLRALEAQAIRQALVACSGHRTRAARLLGISERTLRNKLNRSRPAA